MNKSRRKRIISSMALCAVSLSTLMTTGCGKSSDDRYTIAVITKQNISFWEDVKDGAEKAGDELDVKIIYNEGSDKDYPLGDNDFATQIEYIDYAIKEGVDAIVLAPNDTDKLNEALERAADSGIHIININSRASFGGVRSCISSSDMDGGAVAARHAADAVLGSPDIRNGMAAMKSSRDVDVNKIKSGIKKLGEGTVAIIGHTAATADTRIAGFKTQSVTQIASQMAADGFDITKLGMTQEDAAGLFQNFFVDAEKRCATVDESYEEAKKLLTAHPKMICIFTTNTNTTLGACKAVEELGLQDQVYIIGFNADPAELDYLKTGVLDGTVVQNPYNMGFFGVSYAVRAIEDSGVPYALDTGVTYVTADDLDKDSIKLLLDPENY